MIKRGPPVRYPANYQRDYSNNPYINHFPPKIPPKKIPKSTLSNSTKVLLVIAIVFMAAGIIFLVVKGISNNKPEENPIQKFNANLKISNVQVLNYTDINIKLNRNTSEENIEAIVFIFYNSNNSEITRRRISIDTLKEVNFQITFHFANVSKIEKISVIPIFKSESGSEVQGKVEDEYNVSITSGNETIPEEVIPSCTSDLQCNDNNACTTNSCIDGNCSYSPIENCVSCEFSYQCEDSNECTANKCSDGICTYLPIPGCTPCYSALQCEDNNSCTENLCFSGRCLYNKIGNCTSCTSDLQCNDNDVCTTDSCSNNVCSNVAISGCTSCTSLTQCEDNNPCTTNTCSNNKCVYTQIANCAQCSSITQCNDNNICTTDNCLGNTCSNTPINSCTNSDGCCPTGCNYTNDNDCVQCITSNQATACNDNNACTTDSCSNHICSHTSISNCCTLISQCNDNNVCTIDSCSNNLCSNTLISGCTSCTSLTECNDNNACTTDSCSNNICSHTSINSCTNSDGCCPTGCTITTDNDCSASCGNNIREGTEKCDGTDLGGATCSGVLGGGYTGTLKCSNCQFNTSLCIAPCTVSQCNDNNACTTDSCVNNACSHTSISNCCTSSSQCNDNNACTINSCSNNKCIFSAITSCTNNDHCCPTGCNLINDNDCVASCGNNVIEGNEKCDGTALGGATCSGVLGTGYTGAVKCSNCMFNTSLCVAPCTQTCSSLGYACGIRIICGNSISCGTCSSGSTCNVNGSCMKSQTATCTDHIQNQGETGVDCGGPCPSCSSTTLRTFYISPSGVDSSSQDGSINAPWKSLAYACSKATTRGDLIHVEPGTYIETSECTLAVGVSIEGEGITSVIKSHYQTTRLGGINHASISLLSSTDGTNGNQTISNLKLDGDSSTGSIGILVKRRSNVKIHDLTISDFYINGVTFSGANEYVEPSVYATGNELYNNIITNCGQEDGNWNGGGLIQIGGQDGMLIHDNILTATGKSEGHNGNIVNGAYYNKGVKYYRNKSYKPDYDGEAWNFHIESWDVVGGFEIYNNEFYGGDTAIDCAGHFSRKGNYDYSYYIHDNYFTGTPVKTYNGKYEIDIEGPSNTDIWVYRNHFLNLPAPIEICDCNSNPSEERRIYIEYNIFEKCGWNKNSGMWENIFWFHSGSVISDVYFYNNILLGDKVTHTTGIKLEISGTLSNFNVKNNIILNNDNGEFFNIINSGSINGLYVDNNILYNNANNNDPKFSGNAVTSYEFLNNLKVDPMFVSEDNGDFHLQSSSPAINKGVNIGLTRDFDGNSIVGVPDIGAFEYQSTTTCTPNCANKECGSNGCQGSCGACTNAHGTNTCSSSGICQPSCSLGYGNCDGVTSNGCETLLTTTSNCGSCGNSCPSGYSCSGGSCVSSCTPSCSGKNCGNDGCSGSCGSCSSSQTCTNGVCTTQQIIEQADYYVATNGNDNNLGTISQPFASWQKAFSVAQAGDLVYIHGGVYTTSGHYESGTYQGVYIGTKSGTSSSNMIRIFAYPGEHPILDCSSVTGNGNHECITLEGSQYWYIKGLTVRNVVASVNGWNPGFWCSGCSNNIIEDVASYGNDGPGFAISGNNNLFKNCDAYDNDDVLAGGENADGFILGHDTNRYTNAFIGCRAWHNSDDGFDTFGYEGTATYDNCWSFNNGYDTQGDGNGFKLGMTSLSPLSTPQKVLRNCIAADNVQAGFDESQDNPDISEIRQIYNSVSYNNGLGFSFGYGGSSIDTIRNCINYKDGSVGSFGSNIVDHNSWNSNLGVSVSDADFESVDSSQLSKSRNSDGSLPDITFLHLASGSDLIDKGVNVGLPYSGSAPDLGAFEYS